MTHNSNLATKIQRRKVDLMECPATSPKLWNICTGGYMCAGDSGSPLICEVKDGGEQESFRFIGMASAKDSDPQCLGNPSISITYFTNITVLSSWIGKTAKTFGVTLWDD